MKTPIKLYKKENQKEIVIERFLHTKSYSITLSKNKCKGCGICMEICPREAIDIIKPQNDGKKPRITIDQKKCNYCGICEAICLFGAITIEINGNHVIPVVESKSFPQLIRKITIDETKCDSGCSEINEPCPLELIKLSIQTLNDKETHPKETNLSTNGSKVKIEIDKESCPCCRYCENKFPEGTIRVEKIFHGKLRINNKKCAESCHDCVDVCPIPNVLHIAEDGKVQVDELNCIYCGVCRIICPEEDALELVRTRINHTQIHSGTWNKALEKLASTKAVSKELLNKSGKRLQESIIKRFPPEEEYFD